MDKRPLTYVPGYGFASGRVRAGWTIENATRLRLFISVLNSGFRGDVPFQTDMANDRHFQVRYAVPYIN